MKKYSIIILLLMAAAESAGAMEYAEFIRLVAENNATYVAEKYNVDIAEASLKAAKVFNDPELSVEYGNNQDWSLQMGQSVDVGLSVGLDLAGVRRARIDVATSERRMSEAALEAFFANLKLEAAEAWAIAWKLKEGCKALEKAVSDMLLIAQTDSLRLSVGDIGPSDALQSRLEAKSLEGELISMRAEYENSLSQLSMMCGGKTVTEIGGLVFKEIPFGLETLCEMAENNRADLRAAEIGHTLSEDNLRLLKASRAFEMGISLGYSFNTEVRNDIAPAPQFHGLSIGVSIPLKFSSLNKGEMNAAKAEILKSGKYLEAARLQVRTEAVQAWNALKAAETVSARFDGSLLSDAELIASNRKRGYLGGENSLLELLASQQTYREVISKYVDACAERFVRQAALEQAAGLSTVLRSAE